MLFHSQNNHIMVNLLNCVQVECKRMAQPSIDTVNKLLVATSLVGSLTNIHSAYLDCLDQPSFENEIKYQIELLGAAEDLRKMGKTYKLVVEDLDI